MQTENQPQESSAPDIYVNPENVDSFTGGEKSPVEETEAAKPEAKEEAPKAEAKVEDKPEPEAPKKRNGVNERIGEITAARREAERKAEAAERRAASLEARLAQVEKGLQPPNPENFNDAGEYAAAVAKYEGKLSAHDALRTEAKHEINTYTRETKQALYESWDERLAEAEETVPNFKEIVAKAPNIEIPEHLVTEIMESDMGIPLYLHLAQNPREAIHLSRLSPKALSREMLKLELRLSESPAEVKAVEPPKVTKAPPPVEPITARGSSSDGDDYASWAAKRNKESNIRR